jgi:hypothetical protein
MRRWLDREKEAEERVNKWWLGQVAVGEDRRGVEVSYRLAVRPLASLGFAGRHHCLRPP